MTRSSGDEALQTILNDWRDWSFCRYQPSLAQVTPIIGGLTNDCYRLRLAEGDYVLRIEGKNSRALDIDREQEYCIHKHVAAAGLTPLVVFRSNPNSTHYWLRPYVEGTPLNEADLTPAMVVRLAQHLTRLHQLAVDLNIKTLDITAKATRYWQIIDTTNHELLTLKSKLQKALAGMPTEQLCLVHMDPTTPNWIHTPDDKLVLLDWEYAALGHPLWDLTTLLQDAHLSADDKNALVAESAYSKAEWSFAKRQITYLTVLWYRVQGLISDSDLSHQLHELDLR
ncbi:choline/ethanolamine kinase family protein [Thalassolituus sp.]|uniref:choline/ethanolamine kinase family protein n=1 Tax=Thalassolituus sp. TaxID=2030822 RepID=UPI002A81D1E3|nr:choline/ethanolamine kinase family protein [Thalassolituus sp.]